MGISFLGLLFQVAIQSASRQTSTVSEFKFKHATAYELRYQPPNLCPGPSFPSCYRLCKTHADS